MKEKIKILSRRNINLSGNCPMAFAAFAGEKKGEVELKWEAVSGANLYIIQISFYQATLKWVQFDITPRTSCSISGLKCEKKYCFRVSSVNATGRGPWSKIICKKAPK